MTLETGNLKLKTVPEINTALTIPLLQPSYYLPHAARLSAH